MPPNTKWQKVGSRNDIDKTPQPGRASCIACGECEPGTYPDGDICEDCTGGHLGPSIGAIFGMFLALGGAIDIALVKLWAHIRLATYQIILELRLRDGNAHSN